jgi:hypothetical protein
LLSSIELIYEEIDALRFIEKYRRISYIQEGENMVQLITSKTVNTKYSINLLKFEERQGILQDGGDVPYSNLGELPSRYQIADMFRIKYIENKRNMLSLSTPIFEGFMNNSEGHNDCSETFQVFIDKSIKGIAPRLFHSTGCCNGFF